MGPKQAPRSVGTGFFTEVKRPEREINHSAPTQVEVNNESIYISSPLHTFMSWIG
jgi:hypothetical protein